MRESGFYWVKRFGKWSIAEWEERYSDWWMTGTDECFSDDELGEIDERRIVREVE